MIRRTPAKRRKDAGSADSGCYRRDRGHADAQRVRVPGADMYGRGGHKTIPAATVSFVASSMRMNAPVSRFSA
jgi:hypothetical protein